MTAIYNQVKIFSGHCDDIEKQINEWIIAEAVTEIVSIIQGGPNEYSHMSVTLLYKKEVERAFL